MKNMDLHPKKFHRSGAEAKFVDISIYSKCPFTHLHFPVLSHVKS